MPATLGHRQRRGAAIVDAGCGGGYIAKRFPPGVRDGDKGHLEGWGAARRARGVARSGLFVEVGSRYRLRRTERGSRSSSCDGSKKFSGVKAVDGVDLEIHPDEALMVAGENGVGKYTSMILSQVERPTEGEVEVPGESGTFYGPVRSIFRDGNGLAGVCPCPRSGRRAVRPRSRSGSATSGSPR